MISDTAELSSRIDSLENAINSLSKRMDNMEHMIGGFNANKYLDDLDLKSFDLKHKD